MTPRQKRAEILVVGNELLNGTTLDTNSFWISKKLVELGFKVDRKSTVRDELAAISLAFKQCLSRKPDWVFSVGGLGPTYDDMTSRGLARALAKRFMIDNEAVNMVRASYKRKAAIFKRPTRRLTKPSLKMAMIPHGSTPLQNPVGSAPGVLAKSGGTRIILLPGVPSEMRAIFLNSAVPLLKKTSNFVRAENWIKLVGVSESRLSPAISRVSRRYETLYIKSHPKGFEKGRSVIHVQIILTTRPDGKNAGLIAIEAASRTIEAASRKLGAKVSRTKSVR